MQRALLAGTFVLALALGAPASASAQKEDPKRAAPEKMQSAVGTVSRLQAAERTVTVAIAGGSATRFVWTAETKINGTLSQGAKVTVRYTTLPDGQNLAHQISVGH